MDNSTKQQVIEIFEQHRQAPATPFDENRFLDYLLVNPKQNRAVYSSFGGLNRFNEFIDEVQLRFSVYFSIKDRDAHYPLTRFVERIEQLRASPRSSIASMNNQIKRNSRGFTEIVGANLLLLIAVIYAWKDSLWLAVVILIAVAANAWFIRVSLRERQYNKKLLALLVSNTSQNSAD
jgi:hypothetical protein